MELISETKESWKKFPNNAMITPTTTTEPIAVESIPSTFGISRSPIALVARIVAPMPNNVQKDIIANEIGFNFEDIKEMYDTKKRRRLNAVA